MAARDEYVTYKSMLGWIIGSGVGWASLVVSLGWIAWEVHGATPHNGAATQVQVQREITHIRELMAADRLAFKTQADRIEKKLDFLLEK